MSRFLVVAAIMLFALSPAAEAATPSVMIRPGFILLAPTSLTAVASPTQVELSWHDNTANEAGFVVERRESGGAFSVFRNVAAGVIKTTDGTVKPGVTYGYRVRAMALRNGAPTYSAYSGEAVVTIPQQKVMGGEPPPYVVSTGPLTLSGVGFWPAMVTTAPLTLSGVGFWPVMVTTGPLTLSGK